MPSPSPAAKPAIISALLAAALILTSAGCSSDQTQTPQPPETTQSSQSSNAAPTSAAPTTTTPATSSAGRTVTATTRPRSATKKTTRRPAKRDVLTGGRVHAGPLIAAKIDNTSAGFPQFGVSEADIVYVEQVEGGLTRLIALFHSTLPNEVGPIRSVRSTDSELLATYGTPGLAFSGGAGGPLAMLAETDIVDLSPDRGTAAYWRSEFGDSTHNLHVDLAKLAAEADDVGEPRSPGFHFAASTARLTGKKITDISVTMQAGRTGFSYSKGRYVVSHFDHPYVDHDGSAVLTDNVLVQRVQDEPDGTVDSAGAPSYLSHTVGTGTFTLYRGGRSIEGSWTRKSPKAPTKFLDGKGRPVPFKPGKTWVLLAPQSTTVSTS